MKMHIVVSFEMEALLYDTRKNKLEKDHNLEVKMFWKTVPVELFDERPVDDTPEIVHIFIATIFINRIVR